MEELLTLRQYIEERNYDQALELVAELEEMSKEDKISKIFSYAVILLLHLIKQQAEQRTTRSWNFSIYNPSKEIKKSIKGVNQGVIMLARRNSRKSFMMLLIRLLEKLL